MWTWKPVVAAAAASVVALAAACSSSDDGASLGRGGTSSGDPSQSSGGDDAGASSGASGGSSGASGSSSSGSSGSSSGGTLAPGKKTETIPAAGKSRSVLVVAPAAVSSKKLPLVIALHGNGDTAANFIATSGLESAAASKAFVLAAPQGITQTFTVGAQTVPNVDWDAYRTVANGNIDLPLVDAIRTSLVGTGSIDEKKVFTYGYSQGGYLSFRYAMETASSVSCGAVLAAANPLGASLVTGASRKVAISLQIGTNDYGFSNAQSTKTLLEQNGFPLDYHEIAGAGHVPIPGDAMVPLDDCLARSLP